MKHFFSIIKAKLVYPFQTDLLFFLIVWLMIGLPEAAAQVLKREYWCGFLFLLFFWVITYIILVPIDLTRWTRRILKPLFFVILTVFTCLNLYCMYLYHSRLSFDFIEIMANTNSDEIREYLQMYMGLKEYALLAGFIVVFIFAYVIAGKYKGTIRINSGIMGCLLGLSILSVFFNPELKNLNVRWYFNFEDIADLSKYPTNPQIEQTQVEHPDNVIIILGESFAPSHSSLYGYDRMTNPRLTQLRDSGDLIVFNHVTSPATNTSGAFKYILNTYLKDSVSETPWYKTTNLIEVLRNAGYHSIWLSNQAETGVYNNLSSGAAKLCDEAIFIRENSGQIKFDDELVNVTPKFTEEKNAVFYHLMGQHYIFAERYPDNFEVYDKREYKESSEEKRENLATYDNATLYNDYTVAKIIEKYSDTDAIVFYFSDHGLDIYESADDYCGHARNTPTSMAVGTKIPFMVYMSPSYQASNPEIADKIRKATAVSFMTDKFIYAVMDAIGYKFADSDHVERYSPF